jgi:3-hydroxybutyryl-CoA dehydrogenase
MRQLGKEPVVVRRDVPGFIVNRLQYALLREAYALVDADVCSFEDVDRTVVHGLGSRWAAIGPFETMDLAGLDVHAAVAANLWPELASGSEPTPTIADVLATGALGVKNGRGLRGDYDEAAAATLKERRERVLRGLRSLREA